MDAEEDGGTVTNEERPGEKKAQWRVEEITDSKTDKDGKTLYKARCSVYNWLSEQELSGYPQLMRKFLIWKKREDAKKKTREKLKKARDAANQLVDITETANVDAGEEAEEPPPVLTEKKKRARVSLETSVDGSEEARSGPKRSKRLKENDERLTRFYCKYCEKSFRTEDIFTAHMLEHEQDGDLNAKEGISDEIFETVIVGKKKDYKCRICSQVYREKRDASAHQMVHNGTNPWYCEECDKHFLRKYKYSRHMLIHAGTKNYECDICGKTFNGPDYLKRHKMTYCVEGRGRYKCDICDDGFSEKRLLEAHIAIHDGTNPFHCQPCNKYFLKRTPYENHMALHVDYKPYECPNCDKRFVARGDFNRHVKIHENDIYRCHGCKEVYTLHEDLEMHYQMSEGCLEVICTECNVEFPCVSDLRNHLQSYAASCSLDDPGAAVYICNFCQRGFHVQSSFLEHRPTHVCERAKKCIHCDATFNTRERLTTHTKLVHGVSTTYPCVQCGKVFNECAHLKRHTKTVHGKETIYRCLPCDKVFYMRNDYHRHIVTKQHLKTLKEETTAGGKFENVDKLRCAICERVFQHIGELKRHEYLHQRVQVKPETELVFSDTTAEQHPTQASYYRDGVYTLDGEQVILTDQQATLMNARFNVDADGNYGLLYIAEPRVQEVKTNAAVVSTSAAVEKVVGDGIDLAMHKPPVPYKEYSAERNVNAESATVETINEGTNNEQVLIRIPVSMNDTEDESAATTAATTDADVVMDHCNEETFLAISEMVQQGRLDISSLQVIQATSTDSNE